ncbi:MAG: hypothetical protein NC341_06535 [Blautia sp.]|nr:hypothetical protein [Blautia sp.]MCM1200977.1 hypothetical protein [Bacteroides fragilis]
MEISAIAHTVEQNIREGGRFTFSDETVGVPFLMLLFGARMGQARSFELTGLVYSLENDIFRMKGDGTLPDGMQYELELVFSKDGSGVLQVEMPGQMILPEFAGASLACRCAYCEEEGAWNVTFLSSGVLRLEDLMNGAISFLGTAIPPGAFGGAGKISDFCFRYELPFEETEEVSCDMWESDDYPDYNRKKYVSLSFGTDLALDLSAVFEGGNHTGLTITSFLIEKFGGVYGFAFEGNLCIWDFQMPFHIRYDGAAWMLSTFSDDKSVFAIPSVNRLGEIAGIGNLNLPESFSSLSNFVCENIELSVSSDFKTLYSFGVVIANRNVWRLADKPDIHITNLKAGFTREGAGSTVFIAGDFVLADWKLVLAGAYHTENGWIFRCFLSWMDVESTDISGIFRKLCSFAGLGEIPFSLPDLPFQGAELEYRMKTKQFSARMQIGRMRGEFAFDFSQDTSWRVDLAVDYIFQLSALPLVGSDLHLLDGAAIKDIELKADAAGSVLNLNFAGKPMQLKLSAKERKREDARSGENAQKEGAAPVTAKKEVSGSFLWFPLEKRFSVLTIHRLGLGFDGGKIAFAFDAELASDAFALSLDGLSAAITVSEKAEASFHLSGLTVGFQNPSLQIRGGFRHIVSGNVSHYDGTLLISTKGLSILAVGSCSGNSFLAYGMLKTKPGGPPAFSITGLAVGFGCQQYFALPDITQVAEHPLVRAAVEPSFSAGQLLDGLRSRIKTMPGQNFLAAGVSFLSFGMFSSFALLTVSFGQHLEAALLGISRMTVPPMTEKNPIAKADLALKAAFLPEAGVFSVEAQLMPDSFIFSADCRLTGGFALCIWFGGGHEGDFVITMGGYRRGYHKPAHYPDVPRLGFRWNVTSGLALSGELYFALTPSAICAGGRLDAVYTMGMLRAWFTAYADFETGWKPFYYDIGIGVSLGFSVTLDFWLFSRTFTLEMSADLHIWGPEFSGKAKVKWWVISFTISFGADAERVDKISWQEFRKSFLEDAGRNRAAGSVQREAAQENGIVSIQASAGVIGKLAEVEVIQGDTLKLDIESLIPVDSVSLNGAEAAGSVNGGKLGVLPMGENSSLCSELAITITDGLLHAALSRTTAAGRQIMEGTDGYLPEEIRRNVPKAMWAKKKKNGRAGESGLIGNALTGISIRIMPAGCRMFPAGCFLTLDMLADFQKITKTYVFTSVWKVEAAGRDTGFSQLKQKAPDIPKKAGDLAEEMEKFGFAFDFMIGIETMADNAESLFDEEFALL